MLAFCTSCWLGMLSKSPVCPNCGARVDDDPQAYEDRLKAALHHPRAPTRARVCWVLGQRGDSAAIPDLLLMLKDEDVYVRIAALKALVRIGDNSLPPVLQEAANNPGLIIRLAAAQLWKPHEWTAIWKRLKEEQQVNKA
jgi:hypothetical protein